IDPDRGRPRRNAYEGGRCGVESPGRSSGAPRPTRTSAGRALAWTPESAPRFGADSPAGCFAAGASRHAAASAGVVVERYRGVFGWDPWLRPFESESLRAKNHG